MDPENPDVGDALRSLTASAVSTRRDVKILVWAFLWIPLIIFGVGVVVWLVVFQVSSMVASSRADAYAKVQDAYTAAGYTTPSYTTASNQIDGICENLRTGMSHDAGAWRMATGFGDLSTMQALKIVDAADQYVCSR